MQPIVVFGTGDLAKIALEYIDNIVAFVTDDPLEETFCGLPLVGFDKVESYFPPEEYDMLVAVVYGNMNRDRQRICELAKRKRYTLVSYISPYAFVAKSVKIGEHCFIFENNVIQSDVVIGDNVIMWSGNHIGHGSAIGNNVFISSHVVVAGHCSIGDNAFLGVNSTIPNGTSIGKETWVSQGAVIRGSVPSNALVKPSGEFQPLNELVLARSLERLKP